MAQNRQEPDMGAGWHMLAPATPSAVQPAGNTPVSWAVFHSPRPAGSREAKESGPSPAKETNPHAQATFPPSGRGLGLRWRTVQGPGPRRDAEQGHDGDELAAAVAGGRLGARHRRRRAGLVGGTE